MARRFSAQREWNMPFFSATGSRIFLSSKTRESGFDRDSWCMVASLAVGLLF